MPSITLPFTKQSYSCFYYHKDAAVCGGAVEEYFDLGLVNWGDRREIDIKLSTRPSANAYSMSIDCYGDLHIIKSNGRVEVKHIFSDSQILFRRIAKKLGVNHLYVSISY